MPFERKSTPYVYYGETTSLCEECLSPVPAKILIRDGAVYYRKRCRTHGVQMTKVSSDADYFRRTKDYIKPGDRPQTYQSKTDFGCPLDCGLSPDHEQHSCLALIEINEECNLSCPVCFAESGPHTKTHRSLETIEAMMDTLVLSEGEPDVLQISGGEPTIHPQILEVIAAAKARPIRHVMLNTNGVRIAREPDFVAELARFAPGFEVYLQFDSLEKQGLEALRGVDLSTIRRKALENLEAAGLSTTLVVTVKKGVNDHELGLIIDHALRFDCVRGITFQPIQDAGRNEGFDKNRDRLDLAGVRRRIIDQSRHFGEDDLIPLPCNPENIGIAYGLRSGGTLVPVTAMFEPEQLVAAVPNAVSFEKHGPLREAVKTLFSLSSGELNSGERLQSLLCCLPEVPDLERLSYKDVFRISIIQFMDRYNFCVGGVKRSCIHFVTPAGQIIPFDTYNLLYRNGEVDRLRAVVSR